MESASKDLVRVGRVHRVTNLLYLFHFDLIVDLDVRLCSSHTESASIVCIVDRVVLVLLVQRDALDRV